MRSINLTLDEAKRSFEGKPLTKAIVLKIERAGFGYATSAATGRISHIYKPASPKDYENK
jgi:hypothetical protein